MCRDWFTQPILTILFDTNDSPLQISNSYTLFDSPWQYIKYILYYIKYIYILFDSLLITRCHKFGNCFQIDNFFPQLQDMEDRYEECLALLREAQEEMKSLKKKQKPGFIRHHYSFNSPFLPDDSLALELETSLRREADKSEDRR